MYQIKFYLDNNGRSEIIDYLQQLRKLKNNKDAKIKLSKITAYIDLLEENGLLLGQPYIKYLEDDIWELRPLRDRILFAYLTNNTFILLSQFIKQTQKTPRREIERAKKYLKDYKQRGCDIYE